MRWFLAACTLQRKHSEAARCYVPSAVILACRACAMSVELRGVAVLGRRTPDGGPSTARCAAAVVGRRGLSEALRRRVAVGKQVRFYMLPEDEQVFLGFLLTDPLVVLLRNPSDQRAPDVIADPIGVVWTRSRLQETIIWNRAFELREEDIREIHLKEYRSDIGAYVQTGRILFDVSTSAAPVIQYLPGFVRQDGTLAKSRIWADTLRLEGDQLVYKSEAFEAWYDGIARWLRRRLHRVPGMDGYFGSHALEWYRAGGKLGP
jgi:hypothetical protein